LGKPTDRARHANPNTATLQFTAGPFRTDLLGPSHVLTSRHINLTVVTDTSPIIFHLGLDSFTVERELDGYNGLGGKKMTESSPSIRRSSRISVLFQFRIWNLALLVVYVEIAIVDIQDQRRQEPFLIALAAAGFVVYGLIVWLGWHFIKRWESRLGSMPALIVYVIVMGAIYLVATYLYLMAESAYLDGRLARFLPY
jgi:hypothetical protein